MMSLRPVAGALLLAVLVSVEPVAAAKSKKPRVEDIINFQLGVEYSKWLAGPIYYMATPEERREYLALTSDEQAAAFVEEFWRRRDPEPEIFGNPVRELFDRRAEQADRHYRERAVLGRRTDRGAVYVLHGEPELIHHDLGRKPGEPDLEVWVYPKKAEAGLDGEQPRRRYYFVERDGRTVLYTPRSSRRIDIPG